MRKAAELGFAGIYVQEDVGGSGLGRLDAAIIFEELSRGDVATAAFISIHNMASWMIDKYGSTSSAPLPAAPDHHGADRQLLPDRAGVGSDAAGLRTTAERDGDSYVLNGSKAFISGREPATSMSSWRARAWTGPGVSPPSWSRTGRRG
jgi:alkylation response protein AidB-like acyl-CoA dehydrogenase